MIKLPGRRSVLAGLGAGMGTFLAAPALRAAPLPEVRLGILQFGTVQWVAEIIRQHELDTKHGFALRMIKLANNDAGRVALMAGSAEIVVSDWPFVAVQRAGGTKLSFAPFSSSSGGVMTKADAPIHGLADLRGRRLGVAGGPMDKSWLLVQAAGRATQGIDLAAVTELVYAAPPLLGAKLQQGELDAVLTFWNFAAKLEAAGFREAVSVSQCATALGLPSRMSLVGFVFHDQWAEANRTAIEGFLAASDEAMQMLAQSDAEWQQIRPLMNAEDDAVFVRLKQRFKEGIAHPGAAAQEQSAAKLFAILHETGGARATGGIDSFPSGIFWPVRDAPG